MSVEEPHTPAGDPSPEGIFDKTWEIELLISGGVVFALLQLPPLLDRSFIRLEAGLADWWRSASFFAFIYLKGILYTLISAFALHLASRAYWIGLIGLEKVYPEGVRWEKLKSGPITLRTQRELIVPLRPLIARVDLFCSLIFSCAFLIVLACLMSILIVGVYVLVAWGLSWAMGREDPSDLIVPIALGFVLILLIPALLDKHLAGRWTPGGRAERALAVAARAGHRLQVGTFFGSIFYVLFTNLRRRALYAVMAIPLVLFFSFAVSYSMARNRFWRSDALAADREIVPLYYQDQWPEEGISRLAPSIQSDVIGEPYLKLFIPYLPKRHDAAFEKLCSNPRAKLDCAARIHKVALDGRVLPRLTFFFYTHPKSGARGFLAYIPTAGLPRGPHLLRIEPLPARERKWFQEGDPQPFLIRFWI